MAYGDFKIDGVGVLTPSYDLDFTHNITSRYGYRNYNGTMIINPIGIVPNFTWHYRSISDYEYNNILKLVSDSIVDGNSETVFHNVTTYVPGKGFRTIPCYLDQSCLKAKAVTPKGGGLPKWTVDIVWIAKGATKNV